MYQTITLERDKGIAKLMLNRPERLNAINGMMISEINDALDVIEADEESRVVVLHGAGRAYCAGFDLNADAASDRSGVSHWQAELGKQHDFALRFWHCPKPTIAAVHTYCLAYGFEIALACDMTIAAANTRLGAPEIKFGSGILVMMMPWLTTPKIAKEKLLTGDDQISAEEALQIGLINKVVDEGKHLEAALQMAKIIATMDVDAVRLTKQAINRTYEIMGLHTALDMARDLDVQLESLETPSRVKFKEITQKEGLQAALRWRASRYE